jgi:chaperonin GroES
MRAKPINGHVLVRPLEASNQTSGGIYLPDTAKEKLHEGEVVAVADDATEEVAVGDRVIYKEFSGTEIKLENEEHILLSSEDLLAKYSAVDAIPE